MSAPGRGSSVGVVVPCRNEARYVEGLLESLRTQTRRPDRVVIVDDGSTDGTAAVVDAWSRAHQELNVHVVTERGRGPAAAVNAVCVLVVMMPVYCQSFSAEPYGLVTNCWAVVNSARH